MVHISTSGFSAQSILQIRNAQATLSDLSQQLSTGKKSLNLADYTLPEVKRVLDFRNNINKKDSYLNVINTVQPRLDIYAKTLTQVEATANNALSLVNTTQNPSTANINAVGESIKSLLGNTQYFLNQKLGDRYLFSGSRFTTSPVQDLLALPVPPAATDTVAVAAPTLPTYDTAAPGSSAASYVKDTTTIDEGYTLTYGVSSNDSGFQKLILGMRWAYAATQDPTNYTNYMNTARTLLSQSVPELRDIHGTIAANQSRVGEIKANHTTLISDLNGAIDDIQRADSAEVAAKITFTQTQLEASYSVTAKIAQLSLTKYL
jgi:flagellin-like hook-associated protein FlgL